MDLPGFELVLCSERLVTSVAWSLFLSFVKVSRWMSQYSDCDWGTFNAAYKINAAETFIFLYGCKCSTSEKSKWLGCSVNVMNFQVGLNMSIIWKYKHSYYEVLCLTGL